MKRILSIIFLMIFVFVTNALADNISIENSKIILGRTKTVAVNLSNSATDYAAFQLDIYLPKGLSIDKSKTTLTDRTKDGGTLTIGKQKDGAFRLVYSSLSLTPITGTSGAIVNLCLRASSDFDGGTVNVKNIMFGTTDSKSAKMGDVSFEMSKVTPVTVIANTISMTYGDDVPELTYLISDNNVTGSPVLTCEATSASPVGSYPIKVSQGTISDDYYVECVDGTLTIEKAPLTTSAGSYTKKQGDAMPTFKATYTGFKNGETEAVLTKQPVFSTTATEESAPGSYPVSVSSAEAQNYDISYQQGTLTVTQADAVIITARSCTRQYGDDNPTFEYDVQGATFGGVPEITCEAAKESPVGTYAIVVKQGTVKNYNVVLNNGTLTIEKAPLTISAGSYTKKQGDAMPTFKATYTGFKNDETEAVLTKQPVFSTTATEESAPGSYPVSVSSAEAQNYDISYQQGTLTVTQADAVIITARSCTRQYGDDNPTLEYDVQGATLNGVPEITCEAEKDSPVGTYAIVVKQGTVKNYNVVLTNGTLTIEKAPLTISAGSYTKKQGDAMPTFKATYTGFKNGETEAVLTKQPVFSTTATEESVPGSYPVSVSGAEAQNYDISYQQGTLTVTQADAVIITARSCTRQYGDDNPTLEYDVQGATLDGVPEITCEAVKDSPVGTYTIVVKQGTVKNYNVVLTNGTLTIEKAPLTISAGSYTKKQGDAMPTFKATYTGFKNGETEAVLTKQPVFSTTATVESAPDTYPVTVSGAEAQNYDISYQQGTLTVTQADAVIITARSCTRQYGDDNPTLEYDVQGATFGGVPEITCEAAKESPVGTYAIVVKQGTVKNYNVVLNNGTLTIEKAPLTISAGSYTKKQGDAMPNFKATYTGFKNDETEAVLTKQPVFSTTATEESAPGSYPVSVSDAEAQNYDISYRQGTLTVTQADAVIITARSCTRQYGDDNPTLEYDVQGATLDGVPEITCEAVKDSPVGTYAIVVKQGTVKNYNVVLTNGTLTIDKAPLVIAADYYTKKQGEAMPIFKASYYGFKNGETEAVLTKQPVFSTSATEESAPGDYPVTVSGAEAQNYDINYEQGLLTVTQADAVIITARNYTRQYGDDNPTLEYDVQGVPLDGVPEITCEAAKESPVGTYAIVVKQGTVKNYNVVLNDGTLTIEKAPLTISAGNYTKKQGNAMPTFKATYDGFKNDETEAVLTSQPVFSTPANEDSEIGEYPVYVSEAEAQNYELTYVPGVLVVEAKETQAIVWNQEIKAKVGSTVKMEATATSGLPIRYSYYRPMEVVNTYAIPEIDGNKVTFPQVGDYLITAIQDGDDVYAMTADTIQVYVMDDDDGLMYIDGIYYKYVYESTSTLKVVKGYKPYVGKVEIPATANGMPVVEVDGRAFDGSYFLTEIVVGDNVVRCGNDCFGASINLRVVTLPRNSDVRFDYYQFNCDRNIKEIHCRSQVPYYADETTFNGYIDYNTCILYVPTGTKQAYQEAQEWCKFRNIVEEDVPSGIGDVQVVDDNLSWYTMQGVKLPMKPASAGIYIHNGKKVIIK